MALIPVATWRKIREEVEAGTITQLDAARKYGVKPATINKRSCRERWNTPDRLRGLLEAQVRLNQVDVLKREKEQEMGLVLQGHRVAGLQTGGCISDKMSHCDTMTQSKPDTFETIAEGYRTAVAKKFYKLMLESQVQAPRNWRDIEILDRIMRRTLGLDNGTKNNTVVSLQVVNNRLAGTASGQGVILEGDFVTESVTVASNGEAQQCMLTDSNSATDEKQTTAPTDYSEDAVCLSGELRTDSGD